MMKHLKGLALLLVLSANGSFAADYVIDGSGEGMHASVNFKASHIGISSLWGRFNDLRGRFSYDAANLGASSIEVTIDPASIDTNHEARNTHLKSADFLDVEKYPEIKFVSTGFKVKGDGVATVSGDLTLHGVTRSISFDVHRTGEGDSPFGDYRVGFEGSVVLALADFGISPISPEIELFLAIEGVRQ
ncbi:MAG: YceI family protein [Pseudomonadales bacterium]|nr:YceI family protein [Pseudomonadales bacterium]